MYKPGRYSTEYRHEEVRSTCTMVGTSSTRLLASCNQRTNQSYLLLHRVSRVSIALFSSSTAAADGRRQYGDLLCMRTCRFMLSFARWLLACVRLKHGHIPSSNIFFLRRPGDVPSISTGSLMNCVQLTLVFASSVHSVSREEEKNRWRFCSP